MIAVSRRPLANIEGLNFSGIALDLLEPGAAVRLVDKVRPTHLLHLAWNATPGQFWSAANNLDWAAASLNLVRAFLESGGRRAVMAGTCAEYDWTVGTGRLSEDAPLAPATLYGVAKDATRRAACAAGAAHGVPVAWGRLFWLYGPHEKRGRLVSDITAALLRGEPVSVGDGVQRRDFIHVDDAAAAFIAALHGNYDGPFNIGSGVATPVREIVAVIAQAVGRPELIRWGTLPSTPDEPALIEANVTRLQSKIGATPARELKVGLAETVTWWRNHLA